MDKVDWFVSANVAASSQHLALGLYVINIAISLQSIFSIFAFNGVENYETAVMQYLFMVMDVSHLNTKYGGKLRSTCLSNVF